MARENTQTAFRLHIQALSEVQPPKELQALCTQLFAFATCLDRLAEQCKTGALNLKQEQRHAVEDEIILTPLILAIVDTANPVNTHAVATPVQSTFDEACRQAHTLNSLELSDSTADWLLNNIVLAEILPEDALKLWLHSKICQRATQLAREAIAHLYPSWKAWKIPMDDLGD